MAFSGCKNLQRPLSPLRASSSSSFTVILISALSCCCLPGPAGTVLLLLPGALDSGSSGSSSSSSEGKTTTYGVIAPTAMQQNTLVMLNRWNRSGRVFLYHITAPLPPPL